MAWALLPDDSRCPMRGAHTPQDPSKRGLTLTAVIASKREDSSFGCHAPPRGRIGCSILVPCGITDRRLVEQENKIRFLVYLFHIICAWVYIHTGVIGVDDSRRFERPFEKEKEMLWERRKKMIPLF